MTPKTALSFFIVLLIVIAIACELLRPMHKYRSESRELRLNLVSFFGLVAFSWIVREQVLARWGIHLGWESVNQASGLARVVLALVVSDFVIYWIHRSMHTRPLWNAHSWHHSPESLNWLSGCRSSFVHVAMHVVPQVLIVNLLELQGWQLFSYFGVTTFFQFWIHLNVRMKFPRWLNSIFVTPTFHRVHHAKKNIRDKNFSNMLVIWDRLFGSYIDPQSIPETIETGLEEEAPVIRSLIGL